MLGGLPSKIRIPLPWDNPYLHKTPSDNIWVQMKEKTNGQTGHQENGCNCSGKNIKKEKSQQWMIKTCWPVSQIYLTSLKNWKII